MKLNFLLILICTSLFAVSAIEKTSLRYSEVNEMDVELEVSEVEDLENNNNYKLHLVDFHRVIFSINKRQFVHYIQEDFSLDHKFLIKSSLNRIYYPHAPPVLS
jgi:hypothetical protein